jgi:hypothetical protein
MCFIKFLHDFCEILALQMKTFRVHNIVTGGVSVYQPLVLTADPGHRDPESGRTLPSRRQLPWFGWLFAATGDDEW